MTHSVVCSVDSEMKDIEYHVKYGRVQRGPNVMQSCFCQLSKQLSFIPKLWMEALNIWYYIFMDFDS